MISILIVFIILISLGTTISLLFNKSIENCIPLSLFIVIIILYIFGLLDLLKIGIYVVFALSLCSIAYSLYISIFNNKKTVRNVVLVKIAKPGLIYYIAALLLVYWAYEGRRFGLNDDLSHWGLAVRNMMEFDSFASIKESSVIFKKYPPAVSLFQYFISNITKIIYNSFKEADLYYGLNILYFTIMIPLFRNIRFKDLKYILAIGILIIFVPTMFMAGMFQHLQVDGFMSMMVFYSLAIYYTEKSSVFNIICIGLALTIVALTKTTGIIFASIVILIIFSDYLLGKKKYPSFLLNKSNKIRNILIYLIPIVFLLIGYLSWLLYTKDIQQTSFQSETTRNFSFNISGLLNAGNMESAGTIARTMFSESQVPFYGSNMSLFKMGIFSSAIIFDVVSFLYLFFQKNIETKKRHNILIIIINIGFVLYYLGCYFSYLSAFPLSEALIVSGLSRYIGTYLSFAYAILSWIILKEYLFSNSNKGNGLKILPVSFLVFVVLFSGFGPIGNMTILAKHERDKSIQLMQQLSFANDTADKLEYTEDRVYFISSDNALGAGTTAYSTFILANYRMAPNSLSRTEDFTIAPNTDRVIYPWDIGSVERFHISTMLPTVNYTYKEWSDILYKGFTHVYICAFDDTFIKDYGILFEDVDSISSDTLYEVDKTSKLVVLRRIEE